MSPIIGNPKNLLKGKKTRSFCSCFERFLDLIKIKKYILVLDGGNIFPVKAITTSHAYLITSNNIYHQFTQHCSLKTIAFLFQRFEGT